MKIKNIEFPINFLDSETAERYNAAVEAMNAASREYPSGTSCSLAENIRRGCAAIYAFIDALLGEGSSLRIFGNTNNLNTAYSVLGDIVNEAVRQRNEALEKVNGINAALNASKEC